MAGLRRKGKARKGQFFIVGAILLCTLFYLGMPPSETITRIFSSDLEYLHENIGDEFAMALNFGLNQSTSFQDLLNFTRFVYDRMKERRINFTCMWAITEYVSPDAPLTSQVNISVGNFLGLDTTFTVNVSVGASETTASLFVADNSTNSTTFDYDDIDSRYNLTLSFNNYDKKVYLARGRVGLYSLIELNRAGENMRDEVKR